MKYRRKETVVGTLKILGIALLLLTLLSFILSRQPWKTIAAMSLGPFSNLYNFGNLLNAAVPMVLGGLGILIALKASLINLGGEGQIYLSALVTTQVGLCLHGWGPLGAVIALLAGGLCGGLMAALSGLLKAIWKTNELITSYLISSCMINLGNYLVTGPLHDPQTNLLSTRQIAASMQLHQILPPSGLSTALIYAVCLTFIVNAYLFKTKGGYELRMVGINEDFARYGGIGSHGRIVWALFLSGFFHGLAGGMLVLGTYHATLREFSSGIGWSSFSVALIASGNPIAVLPASFFFAWIQSGATIAMQQSDVTSDLAQIAQGLVFLLISSTVLLKGRKNTWN